MSQTKVSGTPACRDYATRVASRPIAAFISLDTGHHAFAFDAIGLERIAINAGYFRRDGEMDRGDGKAVPILFDDDVRFAVHLLGTKFAISSILTNDMVKHAARGVRRAQ